MTFSSGEGSRLLGDRLAGLMAVATVAFALAGAGASWGQGTEGEPPAPESPAPESPAAESPAPESLAPESLAAEVEAVERAFAQTMATRDFSGFQSFLADEAVFFSGPAPLRGKEAVAAGWSRFFSDPEAPFSWEPSAVEVLASGTLALSTGPVRDPEGRIVASFTSIWRREASGTWKIVFDRGCDACAEP